MACIYKNLKYIYSPKGRVEDYMIVENILFIL
jgi:hypothetical protein